jgi:DNA-directed RNA polymerase specialized sigma24 family protein
LRDLYQWTSEDVSTALNITRENQRILLHRAPKETSTEWPLNICPQSLIL